MGSIFFEQIRSCPGEKYRLQNINERVYARLVADLYKRAPVGIIATLINAFILSLVLWGLIPNKTLVMWLAATLIAALFRYYLIKRFNASHAGIEDARMWCRWYITGVALSGILWGSSALFLFPPDSTAHQAVIAFVLAGMVAGGVGTFSSIVPAFLIFMLTALGPLFIRFSMIHDDIHFAMTIMTLLFMILTLMTARRINVSNRELVELKEHFADQVEERTREIEEVNKALVREIKEREQAQAAASLERDKLDTVTRNVGIGLAMISRDYRTLWANRVLEDLIGDVEGRICYETYYGRHKVCSGCGAQKIFSGSSLATHEQVGKDTRGNTVWLQIVTTPIKNPQGDITAALVAVVPITERKQMESALKQSKADWENTFDAISDWVSIIDLDYRVQSTNRSGEELLGISKEEIVGEKCFRLIHGLDEPLPECPFSEMLTSGEKAAVELQSPNGAWMMVTVDPLTDAKGRLTGAVHSIRDITERKRAYSALRESEEKFRAITQSARDAIYCKDSHGRYTFANPVMEELLGRPTREIMEKSAKDFFSPEEASTIEEADRQTLRGNPIQTVQTIRIQDEERIFNLIQVPLWDTDGKVVGLSGIARDITQAKRFETHLQHAAKMEAIGTLAGGIAHQFNNALSGITANIDLLSLILSDKKEMNKNLLSMKESAFRMNQLTAQLLAYARGGKYQARILSLNDFVKDTLTLLQHRIPPSVHLVVQLNSDVPQVKADRTQLQMVLSAALDNALEAMEGFGRIQISTFNEGLDEKSAKFHPGFRPGFYNCLQIEDDGKGMNEETRKRVFEPFYSTKFMGRGLGLAAAYGIIRNHDGFVSIDSRPDEGTTISIYLPVVEGSKTAPPSSI